MKIQYKYKFGDNISGKSIIGTAGSIFSKDPIKKNGILYQRLDFFKGAKCFLNIPITNNPKNAPKKLSEGITGKKIYGESESISKIKKEKHSARHSCKRITLRNNAYCVINIPITSNQS